MGLMIDAGSGIEAIAVWCIGWVVVAAALAHVAFRRRTIARAAP